MSIDRTRQPQPVLSSTAQQNIRTRQKSSAVVEVHGTQEENSGTKIKLSRSLQQLKVDDSRDVNSERLTEIKAKMDDGTLELDSDKIASALMRDIIDFS